MHPSSLDNNNVWSTVSNASFKPIKIAAVCSLLLIAVIFVLSDL